MQIRTSWVASFFLSYVCFDGYSITEKLSARYVRQYNFREFYIVIFVICDIIEGTHQQNSKTIPESPPKTVKERTCPMPKMIHMQLAVQIV
jgi:hypothetical protein